MRIWKRLVLFSCTLLLLVLTSTLIGIFQSPAQSPGPSTIPRRKLDLPLDGYTHITGLDSFTWIPEVWIDSRFSENESKNMTYGFSGFSQLFRPNYPYASDNYRSCLMKYYDSPWKLMPHQDRIQDRYLRDRNLRIEMMDGNIIPKLKKAFSLPLNGRKRRVYIDFYNKDPDSKGHIELANTQLDTASQAVDFHINVNKAWVSTWTGTNNGWYGVQFDSTLLHEFIHTLGYDHPKNIAPDFSNVQGNIVYESGWCIARQNQDKPPGSIMLNGDNTVLFVD